MNRPERTTEVAYDIYRSCEFCGKAGTDENPVVHHQSDALAPECHYHAFGCGDGKGAVPDDPEVWGRPAVHADLSSDAAIR